MCAGRSIGNALCNDSPVTITVPFTRFFTMLARPIALPTRFYLVISLVHDPVVDLLRSLVRSAKSGKWVFAPAHRPGKAGEEIPGSIYIAR